jgi:transcriptional regulator with XRE-family HTH domain
MAENPNPPPGWPTGRARGPREAQAVDLEVARRVRRRRLELGLTQQQMAETVGVSLQQMNKYELGINRISAGRLHQIAQALGVDTSYFFEDVDPGGRDRAGPMAARSQEQRFLELARNVAAIRDPRQREALCRLARDLAALGAGADPPVERPPSPPEPQSGPDR